MEHFTNKMGFRLVTFLACSLCFFTQAVGASDMPEMARVGLYYSDTALTSANLANETGEGYQFGYFDNKTDFVSLGQTTQTAITMVRGGTVYRTGNNFSTSSGDQTMGGYHVIHSRSYATYDEAYAVASTISGGFVAWIEGEFQVRSGFYTSSSAAQAVGASVASPTSTVINMVKTGTTDIILQFDGGSSYPFGIAPDITGESDPLTWFKNIKYRGAFQYQRISGGDLVVSNVVEVDSYIKGVIPFEMSPSWPVEALKAQAVSARTYVVRQIINVTHKSENFDICNTAHCQVYYGTGGPYTATPSTNSDSAVDQTSGMYLWYNSSLAGTFYSSSHGGGSESVSNVWRSTPQSDYPYLAGVIDPYEQLASSINSRSSWTYTFTSNELTTMFNGKGLGVGSSVSSLESVYSPTGNVIELIIHWSNGKTNTIYPSEMRYTSWLNLPSIHFAINQSLPTLSTPSGSGSASNGSGYTVNSTDTINSLTNQYVISGDGTKTQISGDSYIITGSGIIEQATPHQSEDTTTDSANNVLSGSHTATGSVYSFNGSGWGHNIGLSQFGAYAMAHYMGFTYDYILEYYYPGTHVGKT